MWLAAFTIIVHGYHLASIAVFREYRRAHAAAYIVVTLSAVTYCNAVSHEPAALDLKASLALTNLALAALAVPFLLAKRRAVRRDMQRSAPDDEGLEARADPERRRVRLYGLLLIAVMLGASVSHDILLNAGRDALYAWAVPLGGALVFRALVSFSPLGRAAVSDRIYMITGHPRALSPGTEAIVIVAVIGVVIVMAGMDGDLTSVPNRLFFVMVGITWAIWDYTAAHLSLTRAD